MVKSIFLACCWSLGFPLTMFILNVAFSKHQFMFQWSDWVYALLNWGTFCWFQASSQPSRGERHRHREESAQVLQLRGGICCHPSNFVYITLMYFHLTWTDFSFLLFCWKIFRFIQQLSVCLLLRRRLLIQNEYENIPHSIEEWRSRSLLSLSAIFHPQPCM